MINICPGRVLKACKACNSPYKVCKKPVMKYVISLFSEKPAMDYRVLCRVITGLLQGFIDNIQALHTFSLNYRNIIYSNISQIIISIFKDVERQ